MQREGGDVRDIATATIEHRAYRLARRRQQPAGDESLDQWDRRERRAVLLGDELEVEQRRAAATHRGVGPHGRSAERAERVPELAVEAPRLLRRPHDRRRALLGEERVEGLDELVLLVAEREVHLYRAFGVEVPGVNVAGMRAQPPTIAQSGYSATSSSAIS